MVTYCLPNSYYDLTNLVALSKQISKLPVTFGSKVPEWPVFSHPGIILFTHDTTSCDDGPEVLSKFITPYFKYSAIGRYIGLNPQFVGVYDADFTFNLSNSFNVTIIF